MIWALILIPLVGGVSAFFLKSGRLLRALLPAAAAAHFVLAVAAWRTPLPVSTAGGWLALDSASLLFLTISSGLFLAASLYAVDYLGPARKAPIRDYLEGYHFDNRADGVFAGCLLLFLAAMSLVSVSAHLGLLWVAVEATTLASAPLIYHHKHHRSLEAAWKYLLICSVGIALALLGNFFLAVAVSAGSGRETGLLLPELLEQAPQLDPTWLKAAFLLMLVGYGAKMGLAPMHTWLPDAHSEAPSLVSALLSGALLNCAFLAILRMQNVLFRAGLGDFGQGLLVLFGLISMAWGAILLISQTDFKRLLAYSSVEHMGILALGMGVGGAAGTGAMLHSVNHSLAKAALFLVSGNILAVYQSKDIKDVRGLLKVLPVSGFLWLALILAVTGSPPFGLFTSELIILKGMLAEGRHAAAAGYLVALTAAFAAMAWAGLRMCYGTSPATPSRSEWTGGSYFSLAAPAVLTGAVLILGLWTPAPLWSLVQAAAKTFGGGF
ncbi:MAG: proton-conducting transporter membrane subunit [Pseudomonadota bacterium]